MNKPCGDQSNREPPERASEISLPEEGEWSGNFFDFSVRKVQHYRSHFGDDFCMVVFSDINEDAWVMPFREVKATFSDPFIVDGRRWMGDIKCGALQLRRGAPSLHVTRYYKAFGLLSPRS